MKTPEKEAEMLETRFDELKSMVSSFEKLHEENREQFYAEMELFMQRIMAAECVAHGNRSLPNLDKEPQCLHRVMTALFEQTDKQMPHDMFQAHLSGAAVAYIAAKWINKLEDMVNEKQAEVARQHDAPLVTVPKMKLS